jgi:short-subunit dehydrogenase
MGIGEAIAESLSREGANVALLSRSEASHERNHSISKPTLLTGYDRKN